MLENKGLVSVVIPVYNAQMFIESCIDSIFKQSYTNFEIVAVNDGSKDNTLNILESLAKKDSRLKLYSKENGGVSSARNYGISKAKGEFITFVDADDTLVFDALENMVKLMGEDVDFVVCSHNEIKLKAKEHHEQNLRIEADEMADNFRSFDRVIWWPWGKLFRRSIIADNNVTYDPAVTFGEDHIFNLAYAKYIKNAVVISDIIVYNYYYIRGGLSSKYYPDMSEVQKLIYLRIADYFNGIDNVPRRYHKLYAGSYYKGCIDYYIAWCSKKEAVKKIDEATRIYADILDDEIINEFFTPKQADLIKNGKTAALINDYIIKNPRKTIVRKYARKVRNFLEKLQKMAGNKK